MSGKILKKAIAAALVIMLVGGSAAVSPVSVLFGSTAVTARALTGVTVGTGAEHFTQNGDTYTISDAEGWNEFCAAVEAGNDFSGKTVQLSENISVTKMAGTSQTNFKGSFDGKGHTITADISATSEYCGLFRYIGGGTETAPAVIKDLAVKGKLSTNSKYAGGIAGGVSDYVNILNCVSSVTLNSSVNGDGTHGGFIGAADDGTVNIEGCVFNGELKTTSGTDSCGGFVGWSNADLTIKNSLFVPAAVTIGSSGSATFCRNDCTINNCYYIGGFSGGDNFTTQGTRAYLITPEEYYNFYIVLVDHYSVSGINTCDAGLYYNGSIYAAHEKEVTVNVMPRNEDSVVGDTAVFTYIDSEGAVQFLEVTRDTYNNPDKYTFTMPAGNVTVKDNLETEIIGSYTFSKDSSGNILIRTEDDWNNLAETVKDGNDCAGYSFKLTSDLSITRPIGQQTTSSKDSRKRFAGSFDGCGHTLNVELSSDTPYYRYNKGYVSPFAYTKNVEIKNLRTSGTVTSSGQWASGLVGSGDGSTTIENVQVSVNITSNFTSSSSTFTNAGGFIGIPEGKADIKDSWFDGSLAGRDYKYSGGFIGLNKSNDTTLTNCLFVPSSIDAEMEIEGACEFVHNNRNTTCTLSLCYSVTLFGEPENAQGIHVRSEYSDGDEYDEITGPDGNTYYYITKSSSWNELNERFASEQSTEIKLDKDYKGGTNDTCLTVPAGKTLTLDLNGHTIDRGLYTEIVKADGYVIKVEEGGTLLVSDTAGGGSVCGGNNTGNGGGICNYGTLSITGGTIGSTGHSVGNKSKGFGGGIYNASGAEFTMTGGAVSGNSTTVKSGNSQGGGIYVTDGNVTLENCSITNNSAGNSGGGIFISSGNVTVSECTITGNKAYAGVTGGGVFLNSGSFILKDSTVSGNTGTKSSGNGCGVYVKSGYFGISGIVSIIDNIYSKAQCNVYLENNAVINIEGDPTGSTIGVSMKSKTGVFTSGLGTYDIADTFISDNSSYTVRKRDGEGVLLQLHSVAFTENERGTAEFSADTAAKDDTVTITFAPVSGYVVSSVTVNDGAVEATKNSDGTYFFNMPDEDVTVSAVFEEPAVELFTVTWVDTDGSTVLETDEDVQQGTYPSFDGNIEVPDGKTLFWSDGDKIYVDGNLPAVTENVIYTAIIAEPKTLEVGGEYYKGDVVFFGDSCYAADDLDGDYQLGDYDGYAVIGDIEYNSDCNQYEIYDNNDNLIANVTSEIYDDEINVGFKVKSGSGTEADPFLLGMVGYSNITKYTVTFDEDNGNTTTQTVDEHNDAEYYIPEKDGYAFIGWYNTDGTPYFFDEVTSDVTVIAHWMDASLAVDLEVGREYYTGDLVYFGNSFNIVSKQGDFTMVATNDGYMLIGKIEYDSTNNEYVIYADNGLVIAYVTREEFDADTLVGFKIKSGRGTFTDPFEFEMVGNIRTTKHTVQWVDEEGLNVLETDEDVPWGTYPSFGGDIDVPEGKALLWSDGSKVYADGNLPMITKDVTYTAIIADVKTLEVDTVFYEGDVVSFGDYYYVYDNDNDEYPIIRNNGGIIVIESFYYDDGGYSINEDNECNHDLYIKTGSDMGEVAIRVSGGSGTQDNPFTFEIVKLCTVTLPENMELCEGYSLNNGVVFGGTEIKFKAKQGYTAANVKANDEELIAEDGVYTVTVTDDLTIEADVGLQIFTITWVNDDDTVLETDDDAEYGTMPEYNGETPEKESDAQYSYTFIGWDKEFQSVTKDETYKAVYRKDKLPLTNTSELSTDQITTNESFTVICSAKGGTGEYRYSVYSRRDGVSNWTAAQIKDTNTEVALSFAETGMHDICVKTYDETGAVSKKYFSVNVADGEFASIVTLSSDTVATNEALTVSCSAQGGSGEYSYSVYSRREGVSSWMSAQTNDTNTDVELVFMETGMHDICVKTYDETGAMVKKYFRVNVTEGEFASTVTLSAETVATNEALTVSCEAAGGSGEYTYRVFTRREGVSSWSSVQKEDADSTAEIIFAETGWHDICVKTYDGTGLFVKKYFRINVTEGEFAGTVTLSADTVATNETLTVSCSAEGGSGEYTYSVLTRRKGVSNWTSAQINGTNTEAVISFTETGIHEICVKTYDGTGLFVKKYFVVNVTEGEFASRAELSAETVATNETLTVSCGAEGGSGEYTYSVLSRRNGVSNWTSAQIDETSSEAELSFMETGIHEICVKTYDGTGLVVKKYFTVDVTEGEFASTAELSSDKAVVGEAITLNCGATGGAGEYRFSVYTRRSDETSWKTIQAGSSNTELELSFDTEGDYEIYVKTVDCENTTVKSYFNVSISEDA